MTGVFCEQTLHETEAKLKSETEYYRKELSGYRKSVQDLTNQLSVSPPQPSLLFRSAVCCCHARNRDTCAAAD